MFISGNLHEKFCSLQGSSLFCIVVEEWSQPFLPIVSSFSVFLSKLYTNTDRFVFGDGKKIFPLAPVPPISYPKMKVHKKRRFVYLLTIEAYILDIFIIKSRESNLVKLSVMSSELVSMYCPAPGELFHWTLSPHC